MIFGKKLIAGFSFSMILIISAACSSSSKQGGESLESNRILRVGSELKPVAPNQNLSLTDLNAATLQVDLAKDAATHTPSDPGAVNATVLPSCYSAFDAEEVLGVVTCDLDKKKVVDLKAKNILQVCSFNKDFQIQPSEKLAIECDGNISIEKYSFDPALEISLK